MTLYSIIEKLKMLALKHPNVNSAYEGNIYDIMNANPEQKYASVVLTQQSHTQDDTYDHYGFNLFYVDRLVDDLDTNRVQIQSTGKSMLSNIIKAFCEEFDAECDTINYQTFTERFADECAGAYATITIDMVKDIYCTEKYWDESWATPLITVRNQNKSVEFTANGTYTVTYDATNYSGLGKVEVEVNVPDLNGSFDDGYSEGKEDGIQEGYADGKQDGYTEGFDTGKNQGLEEGYADGKADGIEEGYSQGKTDGFNEGKAEGYIEGKEKGISEQKAKLEGITITENGTYTKEDGYNEIIVEVPDLNGSYDEGYDVGYSEGVEEGTSNAGAVIAETAQVLNITENGVYTTKYSKNEDSIEEIPTSEGNLIRTVNVNIVPKINVGQENISLGYSQITKVPDWLNIENTTSLDYLFYYCQNLTEIPYLDLSNVKSVRNMFYFCTKLQALPLLDTSNVTDFYGFIRGTNLTTIPPFDTTSAKDISYMLNGCNKLVSIPAFNVPNLTSKPAQFFGSSTYNNLTDFGGFIGLKYSMDDNYGFTRLPNLSYESCINVLNGLYDFTGNGVTPTSSQGKLKVHANFLTTVGDEISIGTDKGWTITA